MFFRVLAGGASALTTDSSPPFGGPSCRQSVPTLPAASVPFTSTANGAGLTPAGSVSVRADAASPSERDAGGSKRAWSPATPGADAASSVTVPL